MRHFHSFSQVLWGAGLALAVMMAGAVAEISSGLSSAWIKTPYTQSRLMVGGYDAETGTLHLGWHVRLRDGWKTYWRAPGEAGLPPRWTWKGENNLRRIAVQWPVPERMNFYGYDTFVYYHEVILPLEVSLKRTDRPTELSLELDYMVCSDVCVPLSGEYHLKLPVPEKIEVSPYQKALLQKYRARVPQLLPPGRVEARDGGDHLKIRAPAAGLGGAVRDVYMEGPQGYYFSKPEKAPSEVGPDETVEFRIAYEKGANAPALSGQELVLTFVTEQGRGFEMRTRVLPR